MTPSGRGVEEDQISADRHPWNFYVLVCDGYECSSDRFIQVQPLCSLSACADDLLECGVQLTIFTVYGFFDYGPVHAGSLGGKPDPFCGFLLVLPLVNLLTPLVLVHVF